MTIITFLIILSVLIIAHELGHFVTAKLSGMRVDEFGLGYPPRAKKLFHSKGTDFTLNWLPFGGFVRIFGENPEEGNRDPQSFTSRPKKLQALVLIAGVTANFLLAWLLFSIGFVIGLPASASPDFQITHPQSTIVEVLPGSPAARADVRTGDVLKNISRNGVNSDLRPEAATQFITSSAQPVVLTLLRGQENLTKTVTPEAGLISDRPAIGIAIDEVGIAKLPPGKAIVVGAKTTWNLTKETAVGLWTFTKNIFIGHPDFSQVAGPVGLVGIVGQAEHLGFNYLLSLTALISINLAILNLIPIPALDGGRLLFVAIEALRRKPVPARVFNTVNNIGFTLLLILMALVTVRDVARLI